MGAVLFLAYRRIYRQTDSRIDKQTDGRTDRLTDSHDKLVVAFCNFANARQAGFGKHVNKEHLRNAVSDCAVVLNKFTLATRCVSHCSWTAAVLCRCKYRSFISFRADGADATIWLVKCNQRLPWRCHQSGNSLVLSLSQQVFCVCSVTV